MSTKPPPTRQIALPFTVRPEGHQAAGADTGLVAVVGAVEARADKKRGRGSTR